MSILSDLSADIRREPLSWLMRALGVIPILAIPTAWVPRVVWRLDMRADVLLLLIALGYAALVIALRVGELRGRRASIGRTLLIGACTFAPLLVVALNVRSLYFDQRSVLIASALALVIAWLGASWQKMRAARALVIAVAVFAAVFAAVAVQVVIQTGAFKKQDRRVLEAMEVNTSLYTLRVNAYREWVPHQITQQGGIATFGDRYLLATGDGEFYTFAEREGSAPLVGSLDVRKLKRASPINRDAWLKEMKGVGVTVEWFRLADVMTQETPTSVRVFVSHHWWHQGEHCFTMRVSMWEGTREDFVADAAPGAWRVLYDILPCISVVMPGKAPRFGGIENGGRLAQFDDQHVLLSVGDHAMDGWGDTRKVAQDPNSGYGKTILIDIATGTGAPFTLGHRNPQGLLVTREHRIWATEHGPEGGDELNELKSGGNYGWPLATFGVQYDTHAWPLAETPGGHDRYTNPMYSWIPSIGASNLIEVDSPLFPYWHGDLLIGSLRDRELWRLRLRDNRVVLVEHFKIGERIRDIVQGHRGEIVLWTDDESLMFIEPASDGLSATALYTVCTVCHVATEGKPGSIAPTLVGIVGRTTASVEGFAYSQAMRRAGGRWTRERLDAFLKDPGSVVPGTTMQFGGVPHDNSRRALIEFLSSATEVQLEKAPEPGEL